MTYWSIVDLGGEGEEGRRRERRGEGEGGGEKERRRRVEKRGSNLLQYMQCMPVKSIT